MDAVKSFNSELSALYEVKPPISKAKMTALTRGAIKAIKFYKHVVQSVEKFILKCKPEYKVPGLYVIDSIVRQSRHQFGPDKDVFAPRFSKNIQQTFVNLFKCPPEDKSKIIRVLNLWQKNHVFLPEVIQPLFDLTDPNNPIHKELATTPVQASNGLNTSTVSIVKGSPAMQRTPTKGNQPGNENVHGSANLNLADPNVLQQLQQLQRLLTKNVENSSRSESQVHFDKKLLDFDYGDEEDEVNPSPRPPPNNSDSVTSLLTNPEVLRQLQTLQTMVTAQPEMDMDKMRRMQEMKQQEDEFDKHLAQTVPNLPFAAECEFKASNNQMMGGTFYLDGMNPPAPQYDSSSFDQSHQQLNKSASQESEVEVITLDHDDSRSGTPTDDRYSTRRRRSRSRSRDRRGRDKDRDKDSRKRRSRSRSNSRRYRSRSRDRDRNRKEKEKEKDKDKEKETEKDRERKKRGLPLIKKDHLSVCSTTLWVGHLSKLVHQDDLSNTFGEFGDVVSIDLIPPRGCAFIVMLRRQDAARCLGKLKGHVLHGKAITLAWAPGKGVKGKDLKDYWEGDLGVSYVPYHKIREDIDMEMLEDGGMIDEDTMPQWMRDKVERMGKKLLPNIEMPPNFMIGGEMQNSHRGAGIDTSQPPPMPGPAGLLQPPPMMPLVNPFQFNNRLIGMNVTAGMMANMPSMPNIPIGVPPPNMPGALMQNQLLSLGSPFQGPPSMMPPQLHHVDNKPSLPPTSEANLHSLSESLMNLAAQQQQQQQPFANVVPLPQSHDDAMDVEMEDAERPLLDRGQILRSVPNRDDDGRKDRRGDDRDNRRDDRDRRDERDGRGRRERSRDRERDRDRDKGRDRHNSRDRDRERDRVRDRDVSRGRERDGNRRDRGGGNRWGDRDKDRERRVGDGRTEPEKDDKRVDREKNLNDRLREMAGMGGFDDNRDRNKERSRDRRENGTRPSFQPPQTDDFSRAPPSRGGGRNDFQRGGASMESDFARSDPTDGQQMLNLDKGNDSNDAMVDRNTEMLMNEPDRRMTRDSDRPDDIRPDSVDPMMMEGHPNMMEGPPLILDGPPDMHMHRGPPDILMDRPPNMMMDGPLPNMRDAPPDLPPHMRMRRRPSHLLMDPPPDIIMDRGPNMMMEPPPGMMMDGPPGMMMDGPPPNIMDGPPNMMMDGPPNMMMDGPPNMAMDGPPNMMMDGPPNMMMDGPPNMMMDGPPNMMMESSHRFRGRRDFGPRGMRGPPPDFFPPRDDFGPRGPPMMRGSPNFGPRGPRGRGQFFGPRGPRGRGSFRDGPGFRFEGPPEFFRGPGGPRMMRPPMFDDGPPMRHRGPRFNDDGRWPPGRPDFMEGPPGRPSFDGGPYHDEPPGRDDFHDEGPTGRNDFHDGPPGRLNFGDGPPGRPEFGDGPPGHDSFNDGEVLDRADLMEEVNGSQNRRQARPDRRSRWGGELPARHEEGGEMMDEQSGEMAAAQDSRDDLGEGGDAPAVFGGDGVEGNTTPVRDECPVPEQQHEEQGVYDQGDCGGGNNDEGGVEELAPPGEESTQADE